MRKYAIIDTNISDGAAEYITVCKNRDEAIKKANQEWSTLTKREQEKRDGFIVGIIEVDEDNEPVDGDVIEVVKDYKVKLYTADRETGTFIDEVESLEAGERLIAEYEEDDKAEGTYQADFYDVVNEDHKSVQEDPGVTIRELRALTGLSMQKFGDLYQIPLRTIQHWEGNDRTPPEYIITLLQRVVAEDFG